MGIFESHANVGAVLNSGAVEYDSAKKSYTIAGSGENMWFGADAFQFAWKKMSGDVTLSADISFLGNGGNPHRKAVLMIRQSLDADSVYADVALHGNGLTALQFRDEKGGATQEVQSHDGRAEAACALRSTARTLRCGWLGRMANLKWLEALPRSN